ncbi:MAG: DHH family phosphoesterase [Candidatus Hadarchaeales archaeon]
MYLLLGFTDIAYSVGRMLKERGMDVVVVQEDPKNSERIKLMGFRTVLGDPSSVATLEEASFRDAEAVMVAEGNRARREAILRSVDALKRRMENEQFIIVLTTDESEVRECLRLGANEAVSMTEVTAEQLVGRMERARQVVNEKKLRKILKTRMRENPGEMAIVIQTNPDPDGIASAAALKLYAKSFGVDSRIVYDGVIGHLQNRALVNLLGLELLEAENVDFNRFSTFALVDVASKSHCCLPRDIIPTIVIDHHAVPAGDIGAVHEDITPVGAASTLMTNYLRSAGIEIDRATAAALMLGILTDTMNLSRGTTPQDFEALMYLQRIADPEILRKLIEPPISSETLDAIAKGIKAGKLKGNCLTSYIGVVLNRDIIAQVADFLLNREGVTTSFVYGICGENIYASARTKDPALNLGQILRTAFGEKYAGGHPHMAGATLPARLLRVGQSTTGSRMHSLIAKRFLETIGVIKPSRRGRRSGALPWGA